MGVTGNGTGGNISTNVERAKRTEREYLIDSLTRTLSESSQNSATGSFGLVPPHGRGLAATDTPSDNIDKSL